MRKFGTPFPAGRSAYIVFGAVKGHKGPKAGLFSPRDSAEATQLAARAGLMTLKVSNMVSARLRDQLGEGNIGPKGQLQLHPIRPRVLAELNAKYASQPNSPSQAATNGSPNGSTKPPRGQPPAPPSGFPDLSQLIAACRLVDAVGIWLEKLKVELDEVLAEIGKSSKFSFLNEAETTDGDCYSGGDGWIFDGWRWTYPARHHRQKTGELSVVADIGRPGRPGAALNVPCLLVMWSGVAHNWAGAVDAATGFWPPHEATTMLIGDHCFRWVGKTPGNGSTTVASMQDGSWYFIVRLAALTSFAQLRKLVIQPALALLDGTPVEKTFASATGVMRFRQTGKDFVLDE